MAVVLVGYFLITTVGGSFGGALFSSFSGPLDPVGLTLFYLCLSFFAVCLSVGATLALEGTSFTLASVGLGTVPAKWLLVGAASGLTGLTSFWVLDAYARSSGDAHPPQQAFLEAAIQGTSPQFALLIALGCVLAPIGEEVLFRGVLYTWLRRQGFVLAVCASSLLFGLLHAPHPVFMAHAAIMGILMALLYEGSGSLWPGALAHGLHNAMVFVLARLLL